MLSVLAQTCSNLPHHTTTRTFPLTSAITIMESIQRNQATAAQVKCLEDAAKNPLTGNAWPGNHASILEARRRLPVYGRYQETLDKYHQSQVVILSGETGSGKSTQVPQLLAYDEYAGGLQIACTQPRRIAASSLAARVAEEMGVNLGEEVGFKIRGNSTCDKNNKKTRLIYLTEGVLLNQFRSDKKMSQYACVILDEAHERTCDLGLLFAFLKQTVRIRKDFKVIYTDVSVIP